MTELLSILYKLRIFTLDELSEALKGKVKAVEALLARYKQQGWIVAIRRNTYGAVSILTLKKPRQKWKTFSQSYWFWQNQRKNMCGNSMTRSIFQNCCSKIKRWSIESNFILWLCGRLGVVECFFCKFWKKLLFCLVFCLAQLYR